MVHTGPESPGISLPFTALPRPRRRSQRGHRRRTAPQPGHELALLQPDRSRVHRGEPNHGIGARSIMGPGES